MSDRLPDYLRGMHWPPNSSGKVPAGTFLEALSPEMRAQPLRFRDIEWIAAGIKEAMSQRDKRIALLEERIANFRYVGVFETGKEYKVGNFATHQGGLWHCNKDTAAPPGDGIAWTLAVKRGKDAEPQRTSRSHR